MSQKSGMEILRKRVALMLFALVHEEQSFFPPVTSLYTHPNLGNFWS